MNSADNIYFSVMIAMALMLMMQMSVDKVAIMISMSHFSMSAFSSMDVIGIMSAAACMSVSAFSSVFLGIQMMFIYMTLMFAMKLTIVNISVMIFMFHLLVSAVISMGVCIVVFSLAV